MLIPRRIFALRSLACTDTARYQLCGVHFSREDGKPCATATDGKLLGRVRWAEDKWEEMPESVKASAPVASTAVTLPSADCERAENAVPRRALKPVLENAHLCEATLNGTATISATDLERLECFTAPTVQGTFPDCRDAFPKRAPKARVTIQPKYLLQALKTLLATMEPCGKGEIQVVRLELNGPDKPMALVAEQAHQTATVLVMPLNEAKLPQPTGRSA